MVDGGVERLTDDAGRLLLLPPSLLETLLEHSRDRSFSGDQLLEKWNMLPALSRKAIAPFRLVASRLASTLVERRAFVFCYAIPRQASLFGGSAIHSDGTGRVAVGIPWLMAYHRHPDAHHQYVFADRIGNPRKIILSGDLLRTASEGLTGPIDVGLMQKLAGKHGWSLLDGVERFWRIGTAMADDREFHFVLGM